MNGVSVDSGKHWLVARDERAVALELVLLKQTWVLPWSQLLYARGGEDEVRLTFATHDVVVRGGGLDELLVALAGQRLAAIREPARADRFSGASGRFIRAIVVRSVDEDRNRG